MSRYHPAKRPPNFVHVSKIFWDVEAKDPLTGIVGKVKMSQHCTVVAGRNKEKRFARAIDRMDRAINVARHEVVGVKAPKRNAGVLARALEARKFRQRQGEARV